MAFPWDSLIAAAAGVIGGLGGAGVTGYLANKREEAAADRTEFAAEENRRRDAYAGLLVTSRAALRNLRQLRIAYASGTPNTADVAAVFARGTDVAADMNNATAIAELLGSDEVRPLRRGHLRQGEGLRRLLPRRIGQRRRAREGHKGRARLVRPRLRRAPVRRIGRRDRRIRGRRP
jgi:hypothetical protein